jgi:hypothetical protein
MQIQSLDPRKPSGPLPGKGRGEGEVRKGWKIKPKGEKALPNGVSDHGSPRTTGQASQQSLRSRLPKGKH